MKPFQLASLVHKASGIINSLPNKFAVQIYSRGHRYFMQQFYKSVAKESFLPDIKWQRTLWGLKFQTPLMNASGMFKNGEAYDLMQSQGAGGYIGGTSTYNPRVGNTLDEVYLPFLSLVKSGVSLNYFGLPNLGDEILAKKYITFNKNAQCPIGWSVMRSPDYTETDGMFNLIKSLWMYHNSSQIDFIEINESCPNINVRVDDIVGRLEFIATNFLNKRARHLPVIVKLSNDLTTDILKDLMSILIKYKFDGVNLGNTSTNYQATIGHIAQSEQKLFNYYTSLFGGGIGGRYLKAKSLNLCAAAAKFKKQLNPDYEFHIIRTGGIDNLADIYDSDQVGVSLNQWYTGYFTNYAQFGNNLYKKIFLS